jgi:hypothetical protein
MDELGTNESAGTDTLQSVVSEIAETFDNVQISDDGTNGSNEDETREELLMDDTYNPSEFSIATNVINDDVVTNVVKEEESEKELLMDNAYDHNEFSIAAKVMIDDIAIGVMKGEEIKNVKLIDDTYDLNEFSITADATNNEEMQFEAEFVTPNNQYKFAEEKEEDVIDIDDYYKDEIYAIITQGDETKEMKREKDLSINHGRNDDFPDPVMKIMKGEIEAAIDRGIPLVTILAELKRGVKMEHLSHLSADVPSTVAFEEDPFDMEGGGDGYVEKDQDQWFDVEGGGEGGGNNDVHDIQQEDMREEIQSKQVVYHCLNDSEVPHDNDNGYENEELERDTRPQIGFPKSSSLFNDDMTDSTIAIEKYQEGNIDRMDSNVDEKLILCDEKILTAITSVATGKYQEENIDKIDFDLEQKLIQFDENVVNTAASIALELDTESTFNRIDSNMDEKLIQFDEKLVTTTSSGLEMDTESILDKISSNMDKKMIQFDEKIVTITASGLELDSELTFDKIDSDVEKKITLCAEKLVTTTTSIPLELDTESALQSLPIGWSRFISAEGYPYYYDSTSGESSWEIPCEVCTYMYM